MRQSLSLAVRSFSFGSFFAASSQARLDRVHSQPVLATPTPRPAQETPVASRRPDFLMILLRSLSALAV
jgi:hypothetical protein